MPAGPVLVQAVIPWGFGVGDHAPLPPLTRLLAECGRFGFSRALVLVPSALAGQARAALNSLPSLPQIAMPEVMAVKATRIPAALDEANAHLDAHILLLDPAVVLDANWLDLTLALAGCGQALTLTPGDGPFMLEDGQVRPRLDPSRPGLAWAGAAVVRRDAMAACDGCADLPAFFLNLAQRGRTGSLIVPPQAVLAATEDLPARPTRPALFLDRDGTLNEDYGYVSDPDRLVLLPGAAAAVKRANDLGWYVFLVTNQSGVGRGYYDEVQVRLCNAALQDMLRAKGAHLDDIRYAPDHPEATLERYRSASDWRKPGPGMLMDLMAHWPVRREDSLMVGDKDSDLGAGHAAGIPSLLFQGGDLDAFLAPHLAGKK